nr:putative ABC transporter, ATP-binding protein [Tanacetum cinerariifolium]
CQAGGRSQQAVADVGEQQDDHDADPAHRQHPVTERFERALGGFAPQQPGQQHVVGHHVRLKPWREHRLIEQIVHPVVKPERDERTNGHESEQLDQRLERNRQDHAPVVFGGVEVAGAEDDGEQREHQGNDQCGVLRTRARRVGAGTDEDVHPQHDAFELQRNVGQNADQADQRDHHGQRCEQQQQNRPEVDGQERPQLFCGLANRAEKRPAGAVDRQRKAVHPGAQSRGQRRTATVPVKGDGKHDGHIGQGDGSDQPAGQRHDELQRQAASGFNGDPSPAGQSRMPGKISARALRWRSPHTRTGASHEPYRLYPAQTVQPTEPPPGSHSPVHPQLCALPCPMDPVFRRGAAGVRPLHGVDVLRHDPHGPGDPHQWAAHRRAAGASSGREPQPFQRAHYQLRAVGDVGAGRVQHCLRFRAAGRGDFVGRRRVVVPDGAADHRALSARRHSVQSGLVGFYLSAGRVRIDHAQAGGGASPGVLFSPGLRVGCCAGSPVARHHEAHRARCLQGRAVCFALHRGQGRVRRVNGRSAPTRDTFERVLDFAAGYVFNVARNRHPAFQSESRSRRHSGQGR